MAALAVFSLLPAAAGAPCVFCDAARSFDLSGLPNKTFTAFSGTPGSNDTSGKTTYITYLVTNPCGSVQSDLCIMNPTSDPVAMRGQPPAGSGGLLSSLCTGLGGLDEAAVHTAADGVTITSQHSKSQKYNLNILCDKTAPADNPPDSAVLYAQDGRQFTWNFTWRHPAACHPSPTPAGGCASPAPPPPPAAVCKACLPQWEPTWGMANSTALYGCNNSGPHNVEEAVKYGIVGYDWSHQKLQWVNDQPMDTDAYLLQQAERVLAADPGIKGGQPKVWLYRNKIKALNWIRQVQEKLDDPAHAGWFVKYAHYKGRSSNDTYSWLHAPACDWYGDAKSGPPKCSEFYHDQGQAPTHLGAGPAYEAARVGQSQVCREQCNCGAVNPCGEYTFDHRNASFADWWINEYMISSQTLDHDPPISLGWLDDGMSVNGVSESAPHGSWQMDTGASPKDMQDHTDAYRANLARLQKELVSRKAFYWQMIQGAGPNVRDVKPRAAGAGTCHSPKPRNVTAGHCTATLREWCQPEPREWQKAHMYEVCTDEMQDTAIARDATAEFLLTRGDFAWIGYSWLGCYAIPKGSPFLRPRPAIWDTDFGGKPSGPCQETAEGSGVFTRKYPKADVSWNCNTATGSIDLH